MPRRPVDAVRRLLLIDAQVPHADSVKARLFSNGDSVTNEEATALSQAFLRDTTEKVTRRFVPCDIWFAHRRRDTLTQGRIIDAPDTVTEAAESGLFTISQEGADFGERMARLFARGFAEGYAHILLIGSETPHLPPAFLIDAWGRLKGEQTDIVLGPTDTGGYYLLGLKQNRPEPLQTFAWSATGALGQTREAMQNAGLRVAQTPVWYAIESGDDLRRLDTDLARGSVVAPHTQAALSQLF